MQDSFSLRYAGVVIKKEYCFLLWLSLIHIFPFISPGFAIDVRSDAAEFVVNISGMKNAKVFFTNAGAEANENAIKVAKQYTGRWKIFSMYRCYHGSSAGAGMLTGEPRRFANEPGPAGFIKYDGPYPCLLYTSCELGLQR